MTCEGPGVRIPPLPPNKGIRMKIEVFALLSDNGDGGYTVRLFPSLEEMEKFQKKSVYGNKTFDPENEYEFGYRSFENPITVEVDENGKLKGHLSFGFGQ